MSLISGLGKWLRDATSENIGLKALALAFSIGLFAYLHGQQDVQQRTIPVSVVALMPLESQKRELMTPIPASIHVTLRGTTRAIDSLIQTGIPAVELDLRDGEKKQAVFRAKMFSVPRGVEVLVIDPPSIELEWQDVVTREIPLQSSITGKPAEGFVVKGEPAVDPKTVSVEGPESVVEVMQFARLAAFDVSGLTEGTYTRRIAIDAPPNRVGYLGRERDAKVTVTITRRVTEQKFDRRPVQVVGVANGRTEPKTVEVRVIGPPEVVRALRADQVVPRADLRSVKGLNLDEQKHGSVSVPVEVDLAQADAVVQPPSVLVKW